MLMTAERQVVLDLERIMAVLPHRPPMLFVTRVTQVFKEEKQVKSRLIAEFEVTDEHCEGHFPGKPVFPGVKIVEALGQASILLVFSLDSKRLEEKVPNLASADGAKFRQPVLPPTTLRLEVELTYLNNKGGKFSGKAFVADQLVAEFRELVILFVSRERR